MPPVPLPVPTPGLPFSNIANVVPAAPQDPPSVDDVILAKAYAQRALVAEKYPGQIDRQTTVGALVYADPSWLPHPVARALQPINQRLNDMNKRFDDMDKRFDDMDKRFDDMDKRFDDIDDRIDGVFAKIDQLITTTAKNHNRTLVDGRPVAFVPVPFPDGTMPSGNVNTPTALTNAAIIDNLSANELRAYCHAYYPTRGYDTGQQQPDRSVIFPYDVTTFEYKGTHSILGLSCCALRQNPAHGTRPIFVSLTHLVVARDPVVFFHLVPKPPRKVKFSVDPQAIIDSDVLLPVNLPDPELMAMHAACARIAAMSGAADQLHLLMQDRDDTEMLTDTTVRLLDSLLRTLPR
ncbi:hypothetical protein GGX14DRAFT_604146 [Mycena pura]|uniref:t-SNARE coiled-coil homology domain-containing protein n=1 Tax=Mycena pura TaxID=153505 RepID=A0AAD6URK2_9AGAR|nr:hypothetical protein GGX14DRAFT_604146 [Mycena pura]